MKNGEKQAADLINQLFNEPQPLDQRNHPVLFYAGLCHPQT